MPDAKHASIATRPEPSALAQLLSDPDRLRDFPIETVERLFVLDQQIRAETARREFSAAFNRVQMAMSPVHKHAKNSQTASTYARAEDVTRMLDPLILAEGFSRSISTEPAENQNTIRFVLILRHTSGHEERHRLDAPIDNVGPKGSPTKTALHGMASSYTYCERHLLCKVFGVVLTADDDGNAAAGVGPGSEVITDDQLQDLESLLSEVSANRDKFLAYFKIASLSQMKRGQLKEAIQLLEVKRR